MQDKITNIIDMFQEKHRHNNGDSKKAIYTLSAAKKKIERAETNIHSVTRFK